MSSHYEMTPYDPSREPDFWSEVPTAPQQGGNGLSHGRGGPRPVQPLDRVRRLLRGRTTLAVVLSIVGALIFAAVGWASQDREYQANGWVRIEPQQQLPTGNSEPVQAYRQFMHSEVKVIENLPIAGMAMEQPVWKEQVGDEWDAGAVAQCTDAKYTNEDSYIYISFRHSDPRIAEAGATAVIQAYEKFFLQRREKASSQTIEAMSGTIAKLQDEIDKLEAQIEEHSKVYGGIEDLQNRRTNLEMDERRVRGELRTVTQNLEFATATRDRVRSDAPLSIEQLVPGDPELVQRMADLEKLKLRRADSIALAKGMNHSEVKALNSLIAAAEADIEQIAQRVRASYFGEIPDGEGKGTIALTTGYIDSLQLQQQWRTADLDRIQEDLAAVAGDKRKLDDLTSQLNARKLQHTDLQNRLDNQQRNSEFQQQLANIEAYPPPAETAAVAKDRRKHMALAGGLVGFALPLGVIILIGLVDRRFRYSEDAAEAADRVTLLGILPNLPDRLSDPNQASIAAHCVHQIRTMLQINHGSDESRAFAITSASRGDGKTSLALALGLSYAASGARTLLVDTDLQHGGLSMRLGVSSDEGIMDALAGADLLRYVCETDVTDLAILPIGRAASNHAGAFSPAAVLHMLDQAKRHFDVIICDTGPILGSIESTPIASAVDGVVLAVSRGQSRPLVSKALGHLESVGATIAGVVFNRAQAADFERSVSGMNLRNGSTRSSGRDGRSSALPNGSVVSHN